MRDLRVADSREPDHGAGAAGYGLRVFATRRPATDTTGKIGATACAADCLGYSPPAAVDGSTSDPACTALLAKIEPTSPIVPAENPIFMANVTRNIGLSLGADICWPGCFEEIVKRLNLSLPIGGDTVDFHVRNGSPSTRTTCASRSVMTLSSIASPTGSIPAASGSRRLSSWTASTSSTTRGRCSRWRSTPPTAP